MKISELITHLQKFPADMNVLYSDYDDDTDEQQTWKEISGVEKLKVGEKKNQQTIISIFSVTKTSRQMIPTPQRDVLMGGGGSKSTGRKNLRNLKSDPVVGKEDYS